jgi:hypothetical protein
MDEEGFRAFMKKKRKTPNTIESCVKTTKEFEIYLEGVGKSLEEATPVDLESFASEGLEKKRVPRSMWSLSYYFLFVKNDALLKIAQQLRGERIKVRRKSFKLKDFRGVRPEHAAALESVDVKDVEKMLEVGRTPPMRKELAEKTGLDIKVIEEFVKLSDLARFPGVKGIRARLYHDAGFDRVAKFRTTTPEELLRITREFVVETEFDGIAPLPKEASSTIEIAKKLPDVVEW